MDNFDLFQRTIKEADFWVDYQKSKDLVDAGIKHYFILLDNNSFKNVKSPKNTLLSDVDGVFGAGYINFFWFAIMTRTPEGEKNPAIFNIRRLTKTDRAKLRNDYKFFPENCFVLEWRDPNGFLLLPFIQSTDGHITWLADHGFYRKNFKPSYKNQCANGLSPLVIFPELIDNLPDYYESLFAVIQYNGVEVGIPIKKHSAKITFRNRDKNDNGRRSHLIHAVEEYGRRDLRKADKVKSHLRGTSSLTMRGVDINLLSSFEWSAKKYW